MMKKSELFSLALLMSIFYFAIQEGFYYFNFSSFTFLNTFRMIEEFYLRYLISFLLEIIFFFICGIFMNHFWRYFSKIIHYFVISLILFVIENFSLMIRNLLPPRGLLQAELALFFEIFFITTLFFYSIYYVNLLEYVRNMEENKNDYS